MKIVRIFGGLGNQMFQYALAVGLKHRQPDEDVFIDARCMNGYPLHNGFELDRIFGVELPQAGWRKLLRVGYPLPHYRLWQIGRRLLPRRATMVTETPEMDFVPELLTSPSDMLIEGYWQTERYFADVPQAVREAFTFPAFEPGSENEKLAARLQGCESVSLHIRRGDYMKIANASGICTRDYYRKALSEIHLRTNPELVAVFSDDPDWCRANIRELTGNVPAVVVDCNSGASSFRDMQLMSLCRHNVIANSSFSWWGAWLNGNPDKIVTAPSRWMNGPGWPYILPQQWIAVTV